MSEFWDRRTEGQGDVDPALYGTVTDEAAVVALRDRLERAHLARVLPLSGTERVLDLGGGAGRLSLWLAPKVKEVVLVDRSPALLLRAAKRADRLGVNNLSLVEGDVTSYQPEGRFDVIILFGVLTHIDDEALEPLLDRVADALRPGGRVVLKEPVTTDGVPREDRRPATDYLAYFRPREAYAALFAERLTLRYQAPTVAHPIPFFLGGTNEAAASAGGAASTLLSAVAPVWERLDPWIAKAERQLRATPGLDRLLAPVPVLQDLYLFEARSDASRATDEEAALSVVVLAYDEEECLEAVVDELRNDLDGGLGAPFELVLVDDGSTDRTRAIMERMAAVDDRLRIVPLTPNRGIGGALRAGFDAARGAYVTWVPGDGQIGPDVVRSLFDKRREAAVLTTVYTGRDDAWFRHVISQSLNTLIRLRTGSVAKSGGNYLFDRRVWAAHAPRGDDTMMLSTAFRQNVRDAGLEVAEVGIRARARVAGRSKVLNARTILRTLAAALIDRR